jgi:hypothetical protein
MALVWVRANEVQVGHKIRHRGAWTAITAVTPGATTDPGPLVTVGGVVKRIFRAWLWHE